MKIRQIREIQSEEIDVKIAEARQEIAKERAVIAIGSKPDKPKKIRGLKKDIARMLTVKRERELNKGKESVVKQKKALEVKRTK